MPKIKDIYAKEILDSRGNPTVEVTITSISGAIGIAKVPSGASTGKHEAIELKDNDKNRYNGKGVLKAVNNVNTIIKENLIGLDVTKQEEIDNLLIKLDGTYNKANLGANAILAVSLACCRCAASYLNKPLYKYLSKEENHYLPVPMMNILNGGAHSNFSIDFQEIMIVPINAKNFKEALRMGAEVFHKLKEILIKLNYSIGVGDEGGFAPSLSSNEQALKLVCKAIEEANYKLKEDICIALDVASSELYDEESKKYILKKDKKEYTYQEIVDNYYIPLINTYPIISIEDPLAEDDIEGWIYITNKLKDKVQLVGDDLFVTNNDRLLDGIKNNYANSILIKINQIGTITETLKTIETAKKNGYTTIMSHRSGETEDTSIADLAVAVNSLQIKTGSLSRSERIAKYNRLLTIEDELTNHYSKNLVTYLKEKSFK